MPRPQPTFIADNNKLLFQDRAIHDWYRFVLSFPPHLVSEYLDRFGAEAQHSVLDPFAGTGTTLVESKKRGIPNYGIEANPIAHFATSVKVDWGVDPDGLLENAQAIGDAALRQLDAHGISDSALLEQPVFNADSRRELRGLRPEAGALLLTDSISPLPLHKTLVLLENIDALADQRFRRHERLALAKALVYSISNLHFGPEVGIGRVKPDANVVEPWLDVVRSMATDLRVWRNRNEVRSDVYNADSRDLAACLPPNSIDIVITSPPYPNEKDYTRTTRLESVLLGFLESKADLRQLKQRLVRSNTRNVYKGDDEDRWIRHHPRIMKLADEIENKRIELGKSSGFERLYSRVTRLYFGGMALHFAQLRSVLRRGARLAYVVGDQASYFRVLIKTGELIAEVAENLGYEVSGIDLFRTRSATATRDQLREEVVCLTWNGHRTHFSVGEVEPMPKKPASRQPKADWHQETQRRHFRLP